jgi:hypothetical protein
MLGLGAMAFLSAKLLVSTVCSSCLLVAGLVQWRSNHFAMALRSNVWPSAVNTGSTIISCVIGHIKELGGLALTDIPDNVVPDLPGFRSPPLEYSTFFLLRSKYQQHLGKQIPRARDPHCESRCWLIDEHFFN